MRKIGFIGAYDKIDFVIYIAKILVEMGQRVLVVDGTITQKARYIVPTIEPTTTYITEFEGIDIAVGLKSLSHIKDYLGIPEINGLLYDIVLIDTDMAEGVENYEMENCEKIYFATSFDMYSIKRGIESISGIQTTVNATKVWITNSGDVVLEHNKSRIPEKDLKYIMGTITSNYFMIIEQWKFHSANKEIKFYC